MTATATIDSQSLSDRLGSVAPPRVLDVRTPGEFETAHIAGAYNAPLDLLREHRDEIINRGATCDAQSIVSQLVCATPADCKAS